MCKIYTEIKDNKDLKIVLNHLESNGIKVNGFKAEVMYLELKDDKCFIGYDGTPGFGTPTAGFTRQEWYDENGYERKDVVFRPESKPKFKKRYAVLALLVGGIIYKARN